MAYIPPDHIVFVDLFPSFAAVSDEAYDFWSARAGRVVERMQDCLGDDMDLAAMLATAHYLCQNGLGTGAEAQMAAEGMGSFKSIKSGTLSLDRGEVSTDGGDWAGTSYGQRLWPMLKACVAGPRVTGTGCVVGGGGFNGLAGPLPGWF